MGDPSWWLTVAIAMVQSTGCRCMGRRQVPTGFGPLARFYPTAAFRCSDPAGREPGARVRIELRDLKTPKGSWLEIRVRDEGPGIPAADREAVFEKFVRLDKDDRNRGALNHGLGLTFCQLAAKTHGGRIWIEDNEPKGSCFCVEIPYSDEAGPIVTT